MLKSYKVQTINEGEVLEVSAEKFVSSNTGKFLYFFIENEVIATFVTENVISVTEHEPVHST